MLESVRAKLEMSDIWRMFLSGDFTPSNHLIASSWDLLTQPASTAAVPDLVEAPCSVSSYIARSGSMVPQRCASIRKYSCCSGPRKLDRSIA